MNIQIHIKYVYNLENKMMKYRLFHRSSAGIKAENAIPIAIITINAPSIK